MKKQSLTVYHGGFLLNACFPLELSWKDQQRWTALKAVLGMKRDQDAFLEAMDRLELML